MSYCRFSDGDVYLYHNWGNKYECCTCSLSDGEIVMFDTPQQALDHLQAHRDAGDDVPQFAFDRLAREIEGEEATNKPSWDDVDDWAEWIAQDRDGEWYGFCTKPYQSYCGDYWTGTVAYLIGEGCPNPNWRNTLERRPEGE